MREAAIPGYRLSKARFSSRVLISLAIFGLFLGLLGAALMTITRTGISAKDVRHYYLGEPLASTAQGADTIIVSEPRPFAELAEVTHLHLMGGSLLLFLLCHLLTLCDLKDSYRLFFYLVSFSTFISTFTLPWLIVYCSPAFSRAFGPSIVIFMGSLLFLCFIPLYEMWFARK